MTWEDRIMARQTFPGPCSAKVGTPEFETWIRQMARWGYQYGPALLDESKRLGELQEFIEGL